MKRLLTMVFAFGALAVLAMPDVVLAQNGRPNRPGARQGRQGRQGPQGRGGMNIRGMLEQLGLSDEQKTKAQEALTKLGDERRAEMEKNREAARPLFEEMRKAREAKDEAKVNELRQKLQALRPQTEPGAAQAKVVEALKPILNEEQLTKLEGLIKAAAERGARGRRPLAEVVLANAKALELTDEQVKKVEELVAAAKKATDDLDAGDREGRVKIARKLQEDVLAVLNEDQKKKLAELNRQAGPAGGFAGMLQGRLESLNLTEEQNGKVKELMDAFQKASADAERGARRELFTKLMSDIQSVLTDEQKKKWEEQRAQRRGGQGRRPGGRRGGNAPAPAPTD